MGKLKVTTTKLQDVKIIEPAVFGDSRGFFTETYSDRDFKEAGINFDFIQDNQSLSSEAGVLRGLHFQRGKAAQTKLIRVVTGAVLDLIVDVRKGSPTYKQWEGYIISASNHRQLLVPKGFAHGFVTLTNDVNFLYKCDNYYNAEADGGFSFKTPELGIQWPIDFDQAITSEKDANQPTFTEFEKNNPFVYGEI
ncbi:dTDP-4-dehydrorhamnose 3,5-epimerase [Pediococcus pentosaceus]|jgi:dTDP-4-dehydrorhamnose 3,5-epimerase|uniref:dTDP-4-dehydrorhamnose 3,5-epimerase n=2 Tax=Companilactobacillus TaxID=2767879 RepID=A0A5P0ZVL0_9LACO|nr:MULTISPECIES: dTDP-4-dehydrorhamnose 3,5-epimerase [Lactobacillaceae]KRK92129.1 dtdp-4-dehydrorhamnose 3,5-epimerase [Companilactobacillus futsaii JCM 17355]MCG0675069.1 dTDP-4-dehydrorhamnose 3,5-epimerase [Lactiplantibacillus plantarum]MCG0863582.1 dTDP-4-dehydrorhamnose 3,5-epimerase [Lactiplantibacillus plantarum]MCG0876249.1 dTDP-4-dehydrorhamnose 3,5-epimerase [Lactiplantibacillus plantarum]MQS97116.1 dTDP-4-dehydrorhamnose 3,5-epimerase [Companilactobacillus halodurans]